MHKVLSIDGGDIARRYYRFQTVLNRGNDDMDDASATNIEALKTKARERIDAKNAALEVLCGQLVG